MGRNIVRLANKNKQNAKVDSNCERNQLAYLGIFLQCLKMSVASFAGASDTVSDNCKNTLKYLLK